MGTTATPRAFRRGGFVFLAAVGFFLFGSGLTFVQSASSSSLDRALAAHRVSISTVAALRDGQPTTAIVSFRFRPDASGPAELRRQKGRAFGGVSGLRIVRPLAYLPTAVVRFMNTRALTVVLRRPDVVGVSPIQHYSTSLEESLPLIRARPNETGRDTYTWGYRGQGTYVAVLDTGADFHEPELGACSAPNVPTSCGIFYAKEYRLP